MNSRNTKAHADIMRVSCLIVAAEDLHLIDVGRLETHHGSSSHRDDRGEVFPSEASFWRDIEQVERDADDAEHQEIDHAHDAGDDDGRVGGAHLLIGDGERRGRQSATTFEPAFAGRVRRGRVDH